MKISLRTIILLGCTSPQKNAAHCTRPMRHVPERQPSDSWCCNLSLKKTPGNFTRCLSLPMHSAPNAAEHVPLPCICSHLHRSLVKPATSQLSRCQYTKIVEHLLCEPTSHPKMTEPLPHTSIMHAALTLHLQHLSPRSTAPQIQVAPSVLTCEPVLTGHQLRCTQLTEGHTQDRPRNYKLMLLQLPLSAATEAIMLTCRP